MDDLFPAPKPPTAPQTRREARRRAREQRRRERGPVVVASAVLAAATAGSLAALLSPSTPTTTTALAPKRGAYPGDPLVAGPDSAAPQRVSTGSAGSTGAAATSRRPSSGSAMSAQARANRGSGAGGVNSDAAQSGADSDQGAANHAPTGDLPSVAVADQGSSARGEATSSGQPLGPEAGQAGQAFGQGAASVSGTGQRGDYARRAANYPPGGALLPESIPAAIARPDPAPATQNPPPTAEPAPDATRTWAAESSATRTTARAARISDLSGRAEYAGPAWPMFTYTLRAASGSGAPATFPVQVSGYRLIARNSTSLTLRASRYYEAVGDLPVRTATYDVCRDQRFYVRWMAVDATARVDASMVDEHVRTVQNAPVHGAAGWMSSYGCVQPALRLSPAGATDSDSARVIVETEVWQR